MRTISIMGFIFFLLVLLCGLAYVSWHVWQVIPLAWQWRLAAVVMLVASFAMLFVMLSRAVDSMPMGLATAVYNVGCSSMIVLLYLFLAFLLLDVGRIVRLVPKEWIFSNGWTAVVIALVVGGLLVVGNIVYHKKAREEIALTTPKKLDRELKIVLASDLHLGYHNRRADLCRWVEMINKENADLIVFGGDIIDMSHRPLIEEDMASVLRQLNAPAYACAGNHEFISGINKAEAFYREAGITLLRDSVAEAEGIYLVGCDDRLNARRKPVSHLIDTLDKSRYILVIDHQPYHLERAERAGADFQFSGHTHRGQVWPISLITDAVYEKSYGSHQRGKTHYYISSGLGIWGGKYRIGTRSEYIVLRIANE